MATGNYYFHTRGFPSDKFIISVGETSFKKKIERGFIMQQLQIIEIMGKRVLTTHQIAEAYRVKEVQISQNFKNNRERFIDGKHYISLSGDELKAFKNQFEKIEVVKNRASHLYLWTEKGALLHAKSLNTDKAWEVYDYLVDFYFRAKEKEEPEKREVVPVKVKTEPLKDESLLMQGRENQDAISIFKILMQVAETSRSKIKTKDLPTYKSHLSGNKIAVRSGMPLEEVNYEIAFELFHAIVNCDKGDMINTPLVKYYNSQAERAAKLIITLLNAQVA